MSRPSSLKNSLLSAGLKALLAGVDLPAWLKAPLTFVSELSSAFAKLPVEQKDALIDAADGELADALSQLRLATDNAAMAAAGVIRVEECVKAIQGTIEANLSPPMIPFPTQRVAQHVEGDGNVVVGGDLHVDMRRTSKRAVQPIIPGTVATDPVKRGYLLHLVDRYNKLKGWQVGKSAMRHAMIHAAYRRELGYSIQTTPLPMFDRAVVYLQGRIRNTKLGRNLAKKGNHLFSTFEEFEAGSQ